VTKQMQLIAVTDVYNIDHCMYLAFPGELYSKLTLFSVCVVPGFGVFFFALWTWTISKVRWYLCCNNDLRPILAPTCIDCWIP
jgi:hypothetical protein